MMSFDITYFGWGVGLVILGWIVGICVRIIMNIAGMVGNLVLPIAFIFMLGISSSSDAYQVVVSGCPVSSPVEITAVMSSQTNVKSFIISTSVSDRNVSAGNASSNTDYKIKAVSDANGQSLLRWSDNGVSFVSSSCALAVVENSQSLSFLIGGLCAMAFALAISSRI